MSQQELQYIYIITANYSQPGGTKLSCLEDVSRGKSIEHQRVLMGLNLLRVGSWSINFGTNQALLLASQADSPSLARLQHRFLGQECNVGIRRVRCAVLGVAIEPLSKVQLAKTKATGKTDASFRWVSASHIGFCIITMLNAL